MRRLAWFTVGFIAGVFPCACFYGSWIFWAAVGALIVTAILYAVNKWRVISRHAAIVCLGCAVGLLWFLFYDATFILVPRVADGQTGYVTIESSDYSKETENGISFEGEVELAGNTYSVKAYLRETVDLKPADTVSGYFRFRLTTVGGIDNPTNHQSEGIFLLAYPASGATISYAERIPYRYYPSLWRHTLLQRMDALFSEDAAAFAKALLLGDRTDITYEQNTAFKVSGISHIIAVSGLHVSILFGLIFALTVSRRRLACIVGIPVLIVFAAIVGFTPSVTRACVMQSLMLLAMATDREYDPMTALAFAVLVMLIANPMAILSVSLQLSAGSVLGILLFSSRIYKYLVPEKRNHAKARNSTHLKLLKWVASAASVTLSASVVTTPLVAYYFGCVSIVGVLTNLLTLWVISFIFYGIVFSLVVSTISVAVAAFIASIISVPMRYVLYAAALLSKLPIAAVYTVSIYVVVWLIGVYILLAVFMLQRKKQPLLLICCILVTLFVSQLLAWTEPLLDNCRVTVLNVGQGQCILFQADGKNFLVDCGGDDNKQSADIAAETLLSQGISRLDGIIVTHYDDDHAGGLGYLLTRIKTDRLILPNVRDEKQVAKTLAELTSASLQYISEDVSYTFDDTKITVIAPISYNTGNESSLCVLFTRENCDILITGDRGELGEMMLLRSHTLPQLDLLIVGHHGSATSTGEELLAATMPQNAIISVGQNNRYGHPSDMVLDRLARIGCSVFRTDIHGTVIFRG